MEHDDPPRRLLTDGRHRDSIDVAADSPRRGGSAGAGGSTPSRFSSLPIGHQVAIGGFLCVLLATSILLAGSLRRGLVAYVHARPDYQLSLNDVALDPPPPSWYRGGSTRFLERVWAGTTEPRTFSALDLDPRRLNLIFRRDPWVRRVVRVETRYPNRVVTRLEYREPVGLASLDENRRVLVDRDGVMLAVEDVDLDALEVVGLAEFPPPSNHRQGEVWGGDDAASRERLVAAARLAGFIKSHRKSLDDALSTTHYVLVQPYGPTDFYVQITAGKSKKEGDSLMFLWEPSEGDSPSRGLSDDQRWSMLCDWVRIHPPGRSGRVIYLIFTPRGVESDPTRLARDASRKNL
ncbi:MAG: hypothetical protein AB7I30_04720 [Isosphaeraceae bacterium]